MCVFEDNYYSKLSWFGHDGLGLHSLLSRLGVHYSEWHIALGLCLPLRWLFGSDWVSHFNLHKPRLGFSSWWRWPGVVQLGVKKRSCPYLQASYDERLAPVTLQLSRRAQGPCYRLPIGLRLGILQFSLYVLNHFWIALIGCILCCPLDAILNCEYYMLATVIWKVLSNFVIRIMKVFLYSSIDG